MLSKKSDFPILSKKGRKLVYLDSASTSLKPKQVIKAVNDFYEGYSANIHRGIYRESEIATEKYEKVREKVAKLINAEPDEIIFTKNTTEGINLVAKTFCHSEQSEEYKKELYPSLTVQGDKKIIRILLSIMEHHSNLIPWQELSVKCKAQSAKLVVLDINENGELDLADLDEKLKGVGLVAITHVSNVLGTINPVQELTKRAKKVGVLVLIDGAQAVPHLKVDVKKIGCDFYVFSGHKMLGPSGVGVLWMKKSIAQQLSPFLTGGGMVSKVTLEKAEYLDAPYKFEAGTPNIEGVIGLGAAIDYLQKIGMEKIKKHEQELTEYALRKLFKVKGLTIYGPRDTKKRSGVISFDIKGIHPHDLASMLDNEGIAVRAGHHCAQPLHQRLGIKASVRISFYVYNSLEEIDKLTEALERIAYKILSTKF